MTAACCPKRDFYPPSKNTPKSKPKKSQPKKNRHKKVGPKKQQKMRLERWERSLFLNFSCFCLETGLKPVLFLLLANADLRYRNHWNLFCTKTKISLKTKIYFITSKNDHFADNCQNCRVTLNKLPRVPTNIEITVFL